MGIVLYERTLDTQFTSHMHSRHPLIRLESQMRGEFNEILQPQHQLVDRMIIWFIAKIDKLGVSVEMVTCCHITTREHVCPLVKCLNLEKYLV